MTENWNEDDTEKLQKLLEKFRAARNDPIMLQCSLDDLEETLKDYRAREAAGRAKLVEMTRFKLSGGNFDIRRAMNLLQRHTVLGTYAYHGHTIFSYFFRAGASRKIIETLADLYWDRWNPNCWDSNGFHRPPNPVTDACLYAQDTDTILHFMHPEHFSEFNHRGYEDDPDMNDEPSNPPLLYFLVRCTGNVPTEQDYDDYAKQNILENPAQVLQKLIGKVRVEGGLYYLLQEALHGLYSDDEPFVALIREICDKYRRNKNPKVLVHTIDGMEDYVIQLRVMMPRITKLQFGGGIDQALLLEYLPLLPALETLECPVIPLGPSLQRALRYCPNLRNLTLWPQQRGRGGYNQVVSVAHDILRARPAMESLSLTGIPETERFHFQNLVYRIQISPNLTKLQLHGLHGSSWDSDGVVAILNDNRLQSLSLEDPSDICDAATAGKLSPIAEAMETNTNTSLKSFTYWPKRHRPECLSRNFRCKCNDPDYNKILYYTLMNCCGRATIRGGNASLEDLVRSLCSAVEMEPNLFDQQVFLLDSNGTHSLLYGLLHEKPELWTG